MITMLRKALRDMRGAAAWFGLGMALYTLAMLLYFPSIQRSVASIKAMLEANRALMQAFGVTDIGTFSGYLGSYILNIMWPLIIGGFAITVGTALVAKEVDSGTIECWLALPASRIALLGAKLVALAVMSAAVVGATVAAIVLGALLVHETLSVAGMLAMGVVMVAFILAIGGASSLISVISTDRGRAAGIAAGLMVGSYLAWMIAGLSSSWSWLKNVSIFTAYDPQTALETGTVRLLPLAILLGIGLLCAVAALAAFRRRDAFA